MQIEIDKLTFTSLELSYSTSTLDALIWNKIERFPCCESAWMQCYPLKTQLCSCNKCLKQFEFEEREMKSTVFILLTVCVVNWQQIGWFLKWMTLRENGCSSIVENYLYLYHLWIQYRNIWTWNWQFVEHLWHDVQIFQIHGVVRVYFTHFLVFYCITIETK